MMPSGSSARASSRGKNSATTSRCPATPAFSSGAKKIRLGLRLCIFTAMLNSVAPKSKHLPFTKVGRTTSSDTIFSYKRSARTYHLPMEEGQQNSSASAKHSVPHQTLRASSLREVPAGVEGQLRGADPGALDRHQGLSDGTAAPHCLSLRHAFGWQQPAAVLDQRAEEGGQERIVSVDRRHLSQVWNLRRREEGHWR